MNKETIKHYLISTGNQIVDKAIIDTSLRLFNEKPFEVAMKNYAHYKTSDVVGLIDRACIELGYEKQTKTPL
ncbi:hypothetical protein IGV50_004411 [Salmonella enterica subsp. enterica serovar Newport]|nr:hypothetical protein [Salmonella enterica subsp. enterica serovar Newport]